MNITDEVLDLLGKPEGVQIEYKAVLPPSRNIAQLVSAFANTEGGYIILGVSDAKGIEVNGLSEDFHANAITHKALDLLAPIPAVIYQYVLAKGKKLYAIKVEKSREPILLEGKAYKRIGTGTKLDVPSDITFSENGFQRIKAINSQLETHKATSTNSQIRIIEHYQSILKLADDMENLLFPVSPSTATTNPEGKILTRILFTSVVDNFETYLSGLLYEIFLANPNTLKSQQQVTLEEVLNCSDLQEFVKYWAKQKIGKLQKGSVKGFIKENKQISDLGTLDQNTQNEIEKILQIRHLYTHRNGIVDEKFLQFFAGTYTQNSEHQLSISEVCDKIWYLSEIVEKLDRAAIQAYKLDTVS